MPPEAQDKRNLSRLRLQVHQTWVRGFLENSLQGQAPLELGLEATPKDVEDPWTKDSELPDQAVRDLTSTKRISEIFDDVGHSLLVLGPPGSGKTTLLAELVRDLLQQAKQDPAKPIPVILNLSSYRGDRELSDWIVQGLKHKYKIPFKFSRSWLKGHRLICILDGLDEVLSADRATCVKAINDFMETVGVPGLAVSTRLEEYTALPIRFRLHGAIRLKPLTKEQIRHFVIRCGPSVKGLREALAKDPTLLSLARSPLMLNVMTLAYHDQSAQSLESSPELPSRDRRNQIFAAYIKRMLHHRGVGRSPHSAANILHWLAKLARQMKRQNEAVFLVENIQPTWLTSKKQLWVYLTATRTLGMLAAGFALLLAFFVIRLGSSPRDQLSWELIRVLIAALVFAFCGGTICSIMDLIWWQREEDSRPGFIQKSIAFSATLLSLSIIPWLFFRMFYDAITILFLVPLVGIPWIFRELRRQGSDDIRTAEAIEWSWSGLLMLALLGPFVGLFLAWITKRIRIGKIRERSGPNQGIHTTLRTAGIVAMAIPLSAFWMVLLLDRWDPGTIGALLLWPMVIGYCIAAFITANVIQHYVLRLILFERGMAPANLVRFLDFSTDRLLFLRRRGGGYIFIHRLLQEHFEELEPRSPTYPSRRLLSQPAVRT